MAIQLRRGVYNNFDPSKLLPGEVAVVQSGDPNTRNGKAVYIATLSGEIKRFAFVEDVEEIVYNVADDIVAQQLADLEERVEALESGGGGSGGSGLTSEVKDALLACFNHVVWDDDDPTGQTYIDELEEALYPTVTTRTVSYSLSHVTSSNNASTVTSGASYTATLTASSGYTINTVTVTMGGADVTSTVYSSGTITIPSVTGNIVITATAVASVSSISAVYTQSGTVYETDTLDSLKSDLVVTATYTGGTTSTIPGTDYILSGTLAEGTSTITVTYGGKTTTFSVTVTANPYLAYWDFTQSLVDTVNGYEFTLSCGSLGTLERTSEGLVFSAPDTGDYSAYAQLPSGVNFPKGSKLTIEFGASDAQFTKNGGHTSGTTYGLGNGCLMSGVITLYWRGARDKFWSYESDWVDRWITTTPDYLHNKTMVIEVASDRTRTVTVDGVAFGTVPGSAISSDTYTFTLGRKTSGQTFHNIKIKKVYVEALSS